MKETIRFGRMGARLFGAPAFGVLLAAGLVGNARAVPSFERQTGQQCAACHVSWPELTPYGRYFKLTGYTIGKSAITSKGFQYLPMAVMLQASVTNTRNNRTVDPVTGAVTNINLRNDSPVFSAASVFVAGRINDYVGGFIQGTYNNLAARTDGSLGGHSNIDNTDLRAAYKYAPSGAGEPAWVVGATLNNNPSAQDLWNSSPAWGYPYTASPLATTPGAHTLIDGRLAQQVVGIGLYAMWQKTLYLEFAGYRTANVLGNLFRAGLPYDKSGGVATLSNFNPYVRIAYTHDWGRNSIMLGTYGMIGNVYPDNLNTSTPRDKYRDAALDSQYQYISDAHTFTAQSTYIWEKQTYDASFPITRDTGAGYGAGPTPANPTDRLRTFRLKGSYYYERTYGATLAVFQTTGSADQGLYGTTASGDPNSPNSTGYTAEIDWLPLQNLRLLLQYTGYTKFNGAKTNYDGAGRNANDNNTLFFDVWVAL